MANTSLNLVSLDFDTNKADFRRFLAENPIFKDYDFEGSNLNLLNELLAYNTFKNGFLVNMLFSEAFLDSAQLRGSVVSHAKELNYLPRSRRSAKASITCTFEADGSSNPYTILKGSPLSTIVKNTSYVFTIPETITVSSSNNTFSFDTDIYEGIYIKDTYTYYPNLENQRFKITNKNVDTNSITVVVYEDGSEIGDTYTYSDTLLGLSSTSKVFFLQMGLNGYYEVLFGDDLFGRKPKANAIVSIDYRISSGTGPNGATKFSLDFDPTGTNELTSITSVETEENAAGGAEPEVLESIRRYAPRYFAAQQRAVAKDDYSSLIMSRYNGILDDCTVYGGEELEPKQYGRIVIALKPTGGTIASDLVKEEISNYLLNKTSIPTRIITEDPEYLYVIVESVVQYDKTLSAKSINEIRGTVENAIVDFSTDNLELFDKDFRYSRFVKDIDDAEVSIVSNDTTIKMSQRIEPRINYKESFVLNFSNEFKNSTQTNEPIVTSSTFTYQNDDGDDFENCYIEDDGAGKLLVRKTVNNTKTTILDNAGSVNYTLGIVTINKLRVSDYDNYISIYGDLASKDIVATKNQIILIDLDDVDVSVIEKRS